MPAGELSHSHQQWLEICLALATEPDLLLLDEPTAGMTPEETELTAQFVVNLNQPGANRARGGARHGVRALYRSIALRYYTMDEYLLRGASTRSSRIRKCAASIWESIER